MASTRFQLALQPVLFVVLLFHAVGCQNTSVSKEHGAGTTLVSAKEPNDSIKALRSSFRETTQTHASRIYRKKLGTERPAWIFAPQGKGATGPLPLILLLHGYGDTASGLMKAWQFERLVKNGQAYLIAPDGRRDRRGRQFWSATDACCNFDAADDSDSAYLQGLIQEALNLFPIDPKRIAVVGHSNGGFMAYRLACDASHLVSHIVVSAGSEWDQSTRCRAKNPVSVLHLHGEYDRIVLANGRKLDPSTSYPQCLTQRCRNESEQCRLNPSCRTSAGCLEECLATMPFALCDRRCRPQGKQREAPLTLPWLLCLAENGCVNFTQFKLNAYPAAFDVSRRWAHRNGCARNQSFATYPFWSFAPNQAFNFTHFSQCDANTQVWFGLGHRMGHALTLPKSFSTQVLTWVAETPRSLSANE